MTTNDELGEDDLRASQLHGSQLRKSQLREDELRIAVVSDTHGLLRPELLPHLRGAAHILHAGDVGTPEILDALRAVAPVTAIRGNVDRWGDCAQLPETEAVQLGGHTLYMLHDLAALDLHPHAAGFAAVIYGHSHRPSIEERDGVLYLNPGSVGPRRFSLPISFAWLTLTPNALRAEIIELSL